MLTQAWANGIAVVVVAGGLANAWFAIHLRPKNPGKPKETAAPAPAKKEPPSEQIVRGNDHRPWTVLHNEAELPRRRG
jgi:hypothetical protein